MNQQVLGLFPWPWLPSLALLIFFSFFLGLLVVISRKSASQLHQSASLLPLEEGERHE